MSRKTIHVVPYKGSWAIKREGADRASKITDTKSEAIEVAREMAWRSNDEVIVHDKKGKITQGKRYGKNPDDDCFITTACVKYYNLLDNCYQLITLRNFRDSYLKSTSEGNKLIKQYYSVAPNIVKLLNEHPNKKKLYKNIFNKINSACAFVDQHRFEEAKNLYIKTVVQLIKYFHIR
jgi:hypothetical protein